MMTNANAIALNPTHANAIEAALIGGDLSRLTVPQRLEYYKATCDSLGLNYLTKPFDYIVLNNKLVLYPNGDCADQLRAIHRVSIVRMEKNVEDDIYEVTAYAELPDGRKDSATGAVYIGNLKGADRANAKMKTETKAKRRVTLSIVGMNGIGGVELPDETVARNHYDDGQGDDPISQREREHGGAARSEWTEELDARVIEQNNVTPPAGNGHSEPKPAPADPLKLLRGWEAQYEDQYATNPPADKYIKDVSAQIVFALKNTAVGDDTDLRHSLKVTLFGTRDLTPAQRTAMLKWLATDTAKTFISDWLLRQQQTISATQEVTAAEPALAS